MKKHFFIEDTHPKIFPNASAVTWSLVLQTRNLANKLKNSKSVMILVVRL
jgi:hypothetical protein